MPPVAAPQAAPTSAPSTLETARSEPPTAKAAAPQLASQARPARRAGSRAACRALCTASLSRPPLADVPERAGCAVSNADMAILKLQHRVSEGWWQRWRARSACAGAAWAPATIAVECRGSHNYTIIIFSLHPSHRLFKEAVK